MARETIYLVQGFTEAWRAEARSADTLQKRSGGAARGGAAGRNDGGRCCILKFG